MGISLPEAEFFAGAQRGGVCFAETLVIARQRMALTDEQTQRVFGRFGIVSSGSSGVYSDEFLADLGAKDLHYLDASDYEGATVLADLNLPLPEKLRGRYPLVIESGTIEHVYRSSMALDNAAGLVAPGGTLLASSPCSGWEGHGFVQINPEFFLRGLGDQRGFTIVNVFLYLHRRKRWFSVADPLVAGRRIEFRARGRATVFVYAQRSSEGPTTHVAPFQADYEAAWTALSGTAPAPTSRVRLPTPVHRRLLRARRWLINLMNSGLDPRYFVQIDLTQTSLGPLSPTGRAA